MSGDLLVIKRSVAGRPNVPNAPTADNGQPDGGTDSVVVDQNATESATRQPSGSDPAVAADGPTRLMDFVQLTKPRIVVMVLVTSAVAALVAAGRTLSPSILLHLLVGTGLIGASAGVMNQVWERRIDLRMKRTENRPLPAGRVSTSVAIFYSVCLGSLGAVCLFWLPSRGPFYWGIVTWVTYILVYTPLKTRTSFNTTVGAVSGALPMMMGYTAAGGRSSDLQGWLLVAVLILWQYPHFMAIAWMYRRQYQEAGFLMTPVVDPSGRSASIQAVVGSLALVTVLITLVGRMQTGYWQWALVAAMVGVSFGLVRASIQFARQRDDQSARRMMRGSLLQLPCAMLVLVAAAVL